MIARVLSVGLKVLFTLCVVFAGGGAVPAAHAGPVIKWRVENPLRLFTDPADSEVHRATYRALTPEQNRN